jgi:hypothetical protein
LEHLNILISKERERRGRKTDMKNEGGEIEKGDGEGRGVIGCTTTGDLNSQ